MITPLAITENRKSKRLCAMTYCDLKPIQFPASRQAHCMTESDDKSNDHQAPSRKELRRLLDEFLFSGSSSEVSSRSRRALQRGVLAKSPSRNGNVFGYNDVVWRRAERRASNLPGVEAQDLINEAYASTLNAIDSGETPDGTIGQFFFRYLNWRATDVFNKQHRHDRSLREQLREIEWMAENSPEGEEALRDEMDRLQKEIDALCPVSLDAAINETGKTLLDELRADDEQQPDAAVANAEEKLELFNDFRLCVESCADNLKHLSATLTWATLDFEPHIRIDDAPQQRAGRHADEDARWPALWFSCQDSYLFTNNANHRRRRKYQFDKISELRSRALHLMTQQQETSGAET